MYFTKFLKGIPSSSIRNDKQAEEMLQSNGLICNWWHKVRTISPSEVLEKLTEENILWHLERYYDVHPATGQPFREDTPYISTTSCVVERDVFQRRNIVFPAFLTALQFATS